MRVSGRFFRTQSVGSIWERQKRKDYLSGRQKSHAIILSDSVSADCIEKVVCLQREKFVSKDSHGSTAPKIVLKDTWQVEQSKRNLFKIDLRIQRIPQNAVLEDQRRMTKIREMVEQAQNGIPNRICHCRHA